MLRFVIPFLVLSGALPAQSVITIDGSDTGRVFEGVGGVSAGAASRLLKDYPEPYRSQILDFLFKPNFGASLQHLKVEIGGDENSSVGAEPTHMRSAVDQNYTRGYEFWLMQQAKSRRPDITLDALAWGAPGWVGGGQFFSRDNINYLINFILGAKNTYGLSIDYLGIWNETPYQTSWIKDLKAALQTFGVSTKIIAADQTGGNQWRIADDMLADPELMAAVDVIGDHHAANASSANAQATGKPLWDSEDGPVRGDWQGAQHIAQILIENYPGWKTTKTELWALIASYYDIASFPRSGLMLANTPWSGNFTVQPPIWAVAHVTQFAQPGWHYLDGACGTLTSGNYITLVAPNGTDYSTILETKGAYGSQTVTFVIQNGLSTGPVHVWTSNASEQFVQRNDILPVGGTFSITLAPNSIYSLTTTTGQTKGSATPPPSAPFPFPYFEPFEQYGAGATPPYFSDFGGAFETASCGGARGGLCLRQVVNTPPIAWPTAATDLPRTFLGDVTWTDYQESVDVLFEQAGGSAALYGRLNGIRMTDAYLYGYQLRLDGAGNWSLLSSATELASGTIAAPGLNTWHTLKLVFSGPWIQPVIDGTSLAHVYDTSFTAGLGGLGSSWANTEFDNFKVDYLAGAAPVTVTPAAVTLGGSQTQQFTASVAGGNNQVVWSNTPGASAITTAGLYTAPPFVATTQTVTVTATSATDPTKSGMAVVTLIPVSLGISPSAAILTAGQTQQFTAAVAGSGNTAVTWSLVPAVGSLSSAGLYTPPALITATQSITVKATSVADTTKSASATVTLSPPAPPAIVQQPQNVTVTVGQSANLTVTASGSSLTYRWESKPPGAAGFSPIAGASSSSYSTPLAASTDSGTQFRCTVSNGLTNVTSSAVTLTVVSGTAFLTFTPAAATRNNFTGWVGLKLTIGANAVSVGSLGRFCLAGNSRTHAVKLVSAASGADVPGGVTQINLSGCVAGQFRYAGLAIPVALQPQTTYYLVSAELSGGDQWYDYGTVQPRSVAAVNSAIYSSDSMNWTPASTASTSYVPPNFLYTTAAPGAISVTVQTNPPGRSFSADGTSYATTQTFAWTAGSSHTVAVTTPQSAGTGVQYVWNGWSDGGALSHTVTLTATTTLTANFSPQYSLNTSVSPLTGGSVVANPSSATGYFNGGTSVQLTAVPNPGCSFVNWSGDFSGGANPTTVTMSRPYAGTATFQCSTATTTKFLTSFTANGTPLRNNFNGWVGMKLAVGSSPVSVSSLGRICVAGNTGTHTVKFVSAVTGADLPGGSVVLNMSGCTTGQIRYAALLNPIILHTGVSYYFVSQEINGGDQWYDRGSASFTSAAVVTGSTYSGDGLNWIPSGSQNTSYGPLDFQYSPAPPDAFVTDYNLNNRPLRNDFSGWVGMKFTVGASGMAVNALGRIFVTGNSGKHVIKLVRASDGTDVPGGLVSLSMIGGQTGQFSYVPLATQITLHANTSYYLVSQEVQGGDQWYDYGIVATTGQAAVNSAAYSVDGVNWALASVAQTSYVPVNLK